MSQHSSAKITTDGLVFIYDAENTKSYKGPPTQNIITSRNPLNTSGSGYSFVGTTEYINVPGLGFTNCARVDIINDYSAVSTWCCPNVMQFGGGYSVSPSTTYTYGIVYKCDSGYTNANYMYRYEYNGGTYVLEQGVHSTANRVHLGSGWYFAWGVFTTSATTNSLNGLASFYYNYPKLYDTYRVAKIMLIQGNYAGMHPKYWPDLGTTRSNTQSLVDLRGNYILTGSNIVYNSDGTFEFNGSTSCYDLNTQSLISGTQNFTIEAMYYATPGASSGRELIGNYGSGYTTDALWFATHGLWLNGGIAYHSGGQLYGMNHTVATRSGSTVTLYKNGNVDVTGSTSSSIVSNINWRIGKDVNGNGEPFSGKIYSIKVYDRALTAQEVKQNFNATRGRYGI